MPTEMEMPEMKGAGAKKSPPPRDIQLVDHRGKSMTNNQGIGKVHSYTLVNQEGTLVPQTCELAQMPKGSIGSINPDDNPMALISVLRLLLCCYRRRPLASIICSIGIYAAFHFVTGAIVGYGMWRQGYAVNVEGGDVGTWGAAAAQMFAPAAHVTGNGLVNTATEVSAKVQGVPYQGSTNPAVRQQGTPASPDAVMVNNVTGGVQQVPTGPIRFTGEWRE